jgi:hypothetical protein
MFRTRLTHRPVAALLVAALLALATLGVGHAYAHEGPESRECATCVAVHAPRVESIVTVLGAVALAVAPWLAAPHEAHPRATDLARPPLRGPPSLA